LPVVLYGCETWSLTLRNIDWGFLRTECWGIYLDLKGKMDHEENFIMTNFTACNLDWILLGWLNQGGWGGLDMWHAWGRGEVFTGFWLGGPKVRDHWEDNIKIDLRETGIDGASWIRLAQDRV
jgi:hypothetical protein